MVANVKGSSKLVRNGFLFLVAIGALSGFTARAESAIFWISGPVRGGEVVLLTGSFPKPETISIKTLDMTDLGASWQAAISSRGSSTKPLRANQNAVWFVMPAGLDHITGFRLEESGEAPLFGIVNRPEIWWTLAESPISEALIRNEVESNSASPGATLRIVGRCLPIDPTAKIALVSTSGEATTLKETSKTPYAISATIPETILPGKYAIRLPTPLGVSSEGGMTEITIHPKKTVSLKSVNVADFGTNGNGQFDNSGAFAAALARAASLGGAEVRIPTGSFLLSQPLEIPVGVYLKGASSDLTMLAFKETNSPPDVWVKGTQYFGLEDLSIYCGNHKTIVSSDMSGDPAKSGHIRIFNVRVVGSVLRKSIKPEEMAARTLSVIKAAAKGFETMALSGPDVEVENSYLLGSGRSLFLSDVNGAVIRQNTILNGIWGWYSIDCSNNIVVEDNVFQGADLLSDGGSYATGGLRKRSENIYTANNTYSNFLGNDRQAITSDGGGGEPYAGSILKMEGKTLELAGQPGWGASDWHGSAVVIMAGHGLGQWRKLVSWKGTDLELSAPFQIKPDATSTVVIMPSQLHWTVLHNHFQDLGMSVQIFGAGIEHIVAENDSTRAGGYNIVSLKYYGIQPVLNTEFLHNEIRPGFNFFSGIGVRQAGPSSLYARALPGGAIIGLVLRNNMLADPAFIQIQKADPAAMIAILLDGNHGVNEQLNLKMDKSTSGDVVIH